MKIHVTFALILIHFICTAQKTNFINYKLTDIGNISIPEEMELQSGNYKKHVDEYKAELFEKLDIELSGSSIVFQPRGVNNLEKEGSYLYARIIIDTQIGKTGDYNKLSTILTASKSELSEIDIELKKQVQTLLSKGDIKLLDWLGVSIIKINDYSVIKTSYLRQLNNNPIVKVESYMYQNNDRSHLLTMSYRIQDEDKWKDLFSNILNSFKISNIR